MFLIQVFNNTVRSISTNLNTY